MARYSATRGTSNNPSAKAASQGQVLQLVMAEAARRGMSWFKPHHAAGIVGSYIQETGNFRQDVIDFQIRGDDGSAHGLMQWRGPRYANLLEYARRNNLNPRDIKTQISFSFEEGKQGSPYADGGSVRAFREMTRANTVGDAALAFIHAERPAGYDGNPANAHDAKRRISHATSAIKSSAGSTQGFTNQSTYGNVEARNRSAYSGSVLDNPNQRFQTSYRSQFGSEDRTQLFNEAFMDNMNDAENPDQTDIFSKFGLNNFINDKSSNPFLNGGKVANPLDLRSRYGG